MQILFGLSIILSIATAAKAEITNQQYDSVIEETQERLGPWVLEQYGKDLLVTGDWSKQYSPTSAGGSFYWLNGKWGVHVVGWVAREPYFTADALRLTFCHELGHHIYGGGAEVESDYFATSMCAPIAFKSNDESDYPGSLSENDKQQCAGHIEPSYCERVMKAVNEANTLRATVWRRHGQSETDIANYVSCRRQVFLDGILGNPSSNCEL